jgi:hypothetical protein
MVMHINGNQINDKVYGWGATPFSKDIDIGAGQGPTTGLPANDWTWIKLDTTNGQPATAFVVKEGTNTVGVKGGGWNSLQFAEVDLAPAKSNGSDTIKCKGIDAVADPDGAISFGGIGIPWVASKFKYVALGTAGKVEVTTVANVGGTYKLRIFGQNLTAAKVPLTITEGTTTLATANLPFKYVTGSTTVIDVTGNDVVSPTFTLAAGTHKLALSGAGVNIDYVQLIKQDIQTGVSRDGLQPGMFALEQNYPNPFNPTTTINFSLAKASNVKLTVYNILGQQIRTVVDTRMNAGQQSIVFDASKLASGVYFYRLEAGDFSAVKKMLLLK